MEEEKAVAQSQDSDQAVHRAMDGQPSFSQRAINFSGPHIIGELNIHHGKNKQIFSNGTVLGIISDSLEDFLNNHSCDENMIAPV